jgi:hypothetical protein
LIGLLGPGLWEILDTLAKEHLPGQMAVLMVAGSAAVVVEAAPVFTQLRVMVATAVKTTLAAPVYLAVAEAAVAAAAEAAQRLEELLALQVNQVAQAAKAALA